MITKTKTRYPGITKIVHKDGTTAYRLIITVGTRVDHRGVRREIQQCHTFTTLGEARAKQAELRDARKRGVLVKRDSISFDVLCQRWLDSRHDIREVSRLGYAHLLKAARAQFGTEKAQDLSRADIENLVGILDRRGLAHRSIVGTVGTTRQVLDYGIASGLLSVNVAGRCQAATETAQQGSGGHQAQDSMGMGGAASLPCDG